MCIKLYDLKCSSGSVLVSAQEPVDCPGLVTLGPWNISYRGSNDDNYNIQNAFQVDGTLRIIRGTRRIKITRRMK